MNGTLEKTKVNFSDGILTIQFVENAVVDVEDIVYLYCYGIAQSNGKPYGVLFDTSTTHELTEEAIEYFAGSSHIHNVVAMAYVSKDLISKIRLKLLMIFERPPLKPKIFDDEAKAYEWLRGQVDQLSLSAIQHSK